MLDRSSPSALPQPIIMTGRRGGYRMSIRITRLGRLLADLIDRPFPVAVGIRWEVMCRPSCRLSCRYWPVAANHQRSNDH